MANIYKKKQLIFNASDIFKRRQKATIKLHVFNRYRVFFLNLRSGIICTMYLLFLPATPLSSNFRTSLRALLKFPYPVSASSKIGIDVASLMNSMTSTTCVHEASLLSRTPS